MMWEANFRITGEIKLVDPLHEFAFQRIKIIRTRMDNKRILDMAPQTNFWQDNWGVKSRSPCASLLFRDIFMIHALPENYGL